MSDNFAAWLTAEKAHPLEVKSAPMWTPGPGEVLVRNKAIAINPLDGAIQHSARFPMEYPAILGHDVAGEIVATGPGVVRFKKGDRVLGFTVGVGKGKRQSDNGFQKYSIVFAHLATEIPETMSYESAAVIPCGLATAACGLFQNEPCLELQYPTEPRQKPTGKTILIWGASSSVGLNGTQLAVAAGYEVIATASPRNFDLVKKLGASRVFDYNASTIEDDLVHAFKDKQCVGALDCIGGNACTSSMTVVHRVAGTGRVATTKGGFDKEIEGITVARLFSPTLKDNGVGKAVFEDFLPSALHAGSFTAAPAPSIVGNGLESVQTAVDGILKGVSAKKLVVTLEE